MFQQFPEMDLGEVKLRQIRVDTDVENFYSYIMHEKVTRFLSAEDTPTSLESARSELGYWANLYTTMRSVYWGIATQDDKLIGTCGFNSWNKYHKRAEISYDLSVEHWGKGIMTKAVQSITDFAFGTMQVRRVQATASLDNDPSIRVLEKCRYKREGVMSKYGILGGQSVDYYMYAVVND